MRDPCVLFSDELSRRDWHTSCPIFIIIFFHFLSFSLFSSLFFFFFVGCSKFDFFGVSISLRFLLTVLMKKSNFGPVSGWVLVWVMFSCFSSFFLFFSCFFLLFSLISSFVLHFAFNYIFFQFFHFSSFSSIFLVFPACSFFTFFQSGSMQKRLRPSVAS